MQDSSIRMGSSLPGKTAGQSRRPRRDASEVTTGKVKGQEAAGPAELTGADALLPFSQGCRHPIMHCLLQESWAQPDHVM